MLDAIPMRGTNLTILCGPPRQKDHGVGCSVASIHSSATKLPTVTSTAKTANGAKHRRPRCIERLSSKNMFCRLRAVGSLVLIGGRRLPSWGSGSSSSCRPLHSRGLGRWSRAPSRSEVLAIGPQLLWLSGIWSCKTSRSMLEGIAPGHDLCWLLRTKCGDAWGAQPSSMSSSPSNLESVW